MEEKENKKEIKKEKKTNRYQKITELRNDPERERDITKFFDKGGGMFIAQSDFADVSKLVNRIDTSEKFSKMFNQYPWFVDDLLFIYYTFWFPKKYQWIHQKQVINLSYMNFNKSKYHIHSTHTKLMKLRHRKDILSYCERKNFALVPDYTTGIDHRGRFVFIKKVL